MSSEMKEKIEGIITDYKYGFKTEAESLYQTKRGLSRQTILDISEAKGEPDWMKDLRLAAYETFLQKNNPSWGPDLSQINFDDIIYYIKSSERVEKDWNDVPQNIKDTFQKIGIPEAEQKYLAGVTTQFESEAVYHSTIQELVDLGDRKSVV